MVRGRKSIGVVAGACLALALTTITLDAAQARRAGSRARLRVVSVNVEGITGVALNEVIEIRFNRRVSKRSLTNGAISVLPLEQGTHADDGPRPGELRRRGSRVLFLPTLPTHARDPADPAGEFFASGSPEDDAFEHGSFRTGGDYVVRIAGKDLDELPPARSTRGAKLRRTVTAEFRTADGSLPEDPVFLLEEYTADPPPVVVFSNPSDRVVSTFTSYAEVGGTPSVPTAIDITLFCNGIPLGPDTVRFADAVQLLRVESADEPGPPVPVAGDVLLEQDRNRTELVFRPAGPLAERSTYALCVADTVGDLTGIYRLRDHAARERLREMVDFLAAARTHWPAGTPPEELPDPPAELTFDWPLDAAARGELKRNLLEVGDNRPWEVDPRVFLVFTTVRAEIPRAVEFDVAGKSAKRRRARLASIDQVVAPLGLQGVAGAGANVVVPFTLVDAKRRRAFVEVQYGFDRDFDGEIEEDEFAPATPDATDPRHAGDTGTTRTQRGQERHQFAAARRSGRSNAFVWASEADLGLSAFPTTRILYTRQGREIADPNHPGVPLFDAAHPGVVVRMRTVRGRRRASDWVHTERLALNHALRPSLTLDGATPGDPALVQWSGFDADSEDLDGDGVLDPLDGEDRDGDGFLRTTLIAAAFDHYVLGAGEDPAELTSIELADLDWLPCSRRDGVGDPDFGVLSTPNGQPYTFAWDSVEDAVPAGARVILRGRAFDEQELHSRWVYLLDPVTIDD